jgi:hypothetical protein
MGTSIKSGRDFRAEDQPNSALVAIVNDAFQQRYAPGQNIVAAHLTYDKHVLTIVGVVADLPDRTLRNEARPLLFTPLAQMAGGPFGWGQLTLVVRTEARDPRSMAPLVQREIWAMDKKIVIDELSSMNERVAASMHSDRQSAWLFGLFAGVALMIAAIGVYGVAAYTTAQRTREIGIRVALGARRVELAKLVVGQTLGSTMVGIGCGLAGAWLITRLIAARLYGVSALDTATFFGTAVILASVSIAASYVPARKAMTVDPLIALRSE